MKKFGNSLAAKTAAYIVMVSCMMVFVFSASVIVLNAENEWYMKGGEEAERSVKIEAASIAEDLIIHNIYSDADYAETAEFDALKDAQFFEDESSAKGFGYAVYLRSGNGYSDVPLTDLKVDPSMFDSGDIVMRTVEHGDFKTVISIATADPKYLPSDVGSILRMMNFVRESRYRAIAWLAASLVAGFVCLVFLVKYAGARRGIKWLKYIPLDLFAAAVFGGSSLLLDWVSFSGDDRLDVILTAYAAACGISAVLLGAFLVLFAARVKQGEWWKSTVTYQLLRFAGRLITAACKVLRTAALWLWQLIRGLPLVWKTVAGFIIAFVLCLTAPPLGWILAALVVFYTAIKLRAIRMGAHAMAEGDIDVKVDERGLFLDLRDHAEDLNRIQDGINTAVEERMKSERMKAELITNVSHDLKTPLTSIINYVDLLKREKIEGEKAKEYLDVLDRQSQRLKKLLEDLLEASKASTGNIELSLGPCSAYTMMTQVNAEYKSRLDEAGLELVFDEAKACKAAMITADGRSLWRVLDNLMSNIVKYAQPGTRVYESLERVDGRVVMTYKNTSKYPLNISAEELTERFVRGDESRNSSGSGLGLSIAQNLTELQGGGFALEIDGDLFKAIISFDDREKCY